MTVKVTVVSSVGSAEATVELLMGKRTELVGTPELGPVVRPDEITIVWLVLLEVLSGTDVLTPEPERLMSVV